MPTKKRKPVIKEGLSKEGLLMDKVFKKATKRAREEAFKVRRTIMIEKDGWLVMVNKSGRVTRRVKKLAAA